MLTTNQIAQFDVAVQSRIHIAIRYLELDKTQTIAIFSQFLTQLETRNFVRTDEKNDILSWIEEDVCQLGFDGRQIRNIMSSALGLAQADGKSLLKKSHMKEVVRIVRDFKSDYRSQYEKYLNEQKGFMAGR
jgi:hypothetical protein